MDNYGDVATEAADGGRDLVRSVITHKLGSNIEDLALTGSANINATGNELNNTLTGNGSDNTLDGGAGADAMNGGNGNDVYYVDDVADTVTEWWNNGTDSVKASVSFILGANVENLTLTGADNIDGTGNELANVLTGNSADNVLDGREGADTMIGGAGNDIYYVNDAGDMITEWWDKGTDSVFATVSHKLASNIENLTLGGSTDAAGTGNELANEIKGNAGSNVLDGGAGADRLTGGAGLDTFRFLAPGESSVSNHDVIVDFARGDLIDLSTIYGDALAYRHEGAFTGQAGEVQLTASGDGVLVNIDLTGDRASDMQIYLANVSVSTMQEGGADFIL